jgi:hypothetical protein
LSPISSPREQIAKGEFRLAIRALFLASLAHLGERDFLSVAKHKSNLDYERELMRRARSREPLRQSFSENVGIFEGAWYGMHDIADGTVDQFTQNYHSIKGDAPSEVADTATKPKPKLEPGEST